MSARADPHPIRKNDLRPTIHTTSNELLKGIARRQRAGLHRTATASNALRTTELRPTSVPASAATPRRR